MLYLVSRFVFPFLFCSDFNVEATVVKANKIRGLIQFFTPCVLLIGKIIFSKVISNYCIVHQKIHLKNKNDQTFN